MQILCNVKVINRQPRAMQVPADNESGFDSFVAISLIQCLLMSQVLGHHVHADKLAAAAYFGTRHKILCKNMLQIAEDFALFVRMKGGPYIA